MRVVNICICTDNQAVLNALKANVFDSKFPRLKSWVENITGRVTLLWVPKYPQIKDNEMADQSVKQWASRRLYNP